MSVIQRRMVYNYCPFCGGAEVECEVLENKKEWVTCADPDCVCPSYTMHEWKRLKRPGLHTLRMHKHDWHRRRSRACTK